MSALISLVPLVSVHAQRATQVVRYSITGVSQGQISNGTGSSSSTGSAAASSSGSTGFGSVTAVPAAATTAPTSSAPKPPQTVTRAASSVPTTTTSVWQASYQISNNEENKKLAISIDVPMPDGMALTADIGAPQGADATGPVDLETGAHDVVTAIGTGASGVLPIEFSVTSPQGSSENAGSRKVTFTFISGS